MRAFVLGLAVMTLACSSPPPPPAESPRPAEPEVELEVGPYASVYRGDERLRITIAPLAEDPDQALIQVTGVANELDGLVLLYDSVPRGRDRSSYQTTFKGTDFNTVWLHRGGGATRVQIYLPNAGRDPREAVFDERASEAADPQALARLYTELVADGTIATLQKFNRDEREARHDEDFVAALAGSLDGCGSDAAATIDWSGVSDDNLKEYSISGYCGAIRRGLDELCQFPQGKQAFQARVSRIDCAFGSESAVEVSGDGRLIWTVDVDGVNAERVARDLIRAEFGRDRIVLRTDGGLYLTFDPGSAKVPIYYSEDGEVFYEHREAARSASGSNRYLFAGHRRARLTFEGGAWKLACGSNEVQPRELPAAQAQQILADGELRDEERWRREPFALARNDRGTYFYVDRLQDRHGGKGFRVFIGLQGALELTRLVDIVDDSEGTVFSTENGELRLVIDRDDVAGGASWIRAGTREKLLVLPLRDNLQLIYQQLGVYAGESLGSACEAI